MKTLFKNLLFIIFLFNVLTVNALQLGKISVNSKQEQPLNADIEVILTKADDVTELVPSIASKEDFESQGIERLPVHANINANFVKNSEGKIYLKLKSSNPVKDPFLDLLIQIDSPKGRNYREYTVLLDPPDPMDKMINETLEKEASPKNEIKEPSKAIAEGKKVDVKKPEAKPEAKPVKANPGKTLYQIGRENSISGITLEQMVVGIYLKNKQAFQDENINGLNKNELLTLPTREFFDELSHLEARKILKAQNKEWKEKFNIPEDKVAQKKQPTELDNNKIQELESKLAEAEKKLKQLSEPTKNESKIKAETQSDIKQQANKNSEAAKEKNNSINQSDIVDGFEIEQINLSDNNTNNGNDVFTSSISLEPELDKKSIIDDKENKPNNLLIVLILLFVIVIIAGIVFYFSVKRKSEKSLFNSASGEENIQRDIINDLSTSGENKDNF